MTPQTYIFYGRYGAGKGTQAKLLVEKLRSEDTKHKTIYIETGAEFRKFGSEENFTAKHTITQINKGLLMPEYLVIYLWGRRLVTDYTGNEHIVLDGCARKLLEAKILEKVFPFYGLPKPFVIYINISHEEAVKRLSKRNQGRADDTPEAIQKRKAAFEADVVPTVEYFRDNNPNVNFLDIDGERSVEEIHADIVKRVGLK